MEHHIKELILYIPDLIHRKVLDLGSGRGRFVIEIAKRGGDVVGLEPFQEYVAFSQRELKEAGLKAEILQGEGENIPFPDNYFGFINMTEVIEHVENPDMVLREVCRVLQKGGLVYMSVPNRFGMKDQHFNLYLVNWLPRFLSDPFISLFGKHKNYVNTAGKQRLMEMHYRTWGGVEKMASKSGLDSKDIRMLKIERNYKGAKRVIAKFVYKLVKPWYFDSFHVLLEKR